MLSNIQKSIIIKAVRIRVKNGEDLDTVLKSYKKLTDDDRESIKAKYNSTY